MNAARHFTPLNKPDIITIIEHEGFELKRRGRDYWAPCPFHADKTPSFKINIERQRWHCFAENKGGDVIDFISELHGLIFKDACRYLHIIPGKPAPIDPAKEKRRQLLKAFELWRRSYYQELCDRMISIHELRIKAEARKPLPEHLAFYLAEKLSELPFIEYRLDMLSGADDTAKLKLLETWGK